MAFADALVEYPVVFGFDKSLKSTQRFQGYFIDYQRGWDNVAVTPEVREQVAEFIEEGGSASPSFARAAAERIRNLPLRNDGLIYLEHCTTTVISRLPVVA